VKITIRLRRKPGNGGFMLPGKEVRGHDLTDEILL